MIIFPSPDALNLALNTYYETLGVFKASQTSKLLFAGVYLFRQPETRKILYVGQSRVLATRLSQHKRSDTLARCDILIHPFFTVEYPAIDIVENGLILLTSPEINDSLKLKPLREFQNHSALVLLKYVYDNQQKQIAQCQLKVTEPLPVVTPKVAGVRHPRTGEIMPVS